MSDACKETDTEEVSSFRYTSHFPEQRNQESEDLVTKKGSGSSTFQASSFFLRKGVLPFMTCQRGFAPTQTAAKTSKIPLTLMTSFPKKGKAFTYKGLDGMKVDYEFSPSAKCVNLAKCQRIFCQKTFELTENVSMKESIGGNKRRKLVHECLCGTDMAEHLFSLCWGIWFQLVFHSWCDLFPLVPTALWAHLFSFFHTSNIWKQIAYSWQECGSLNM